MRTLIKTILALALALCLCAAAGAEDVDVSGLKLGESLFARDIPLDAKYTLVIGKERMAVATVAAPQEEVVAEPAADAATEPEVIAKGKKEDADAAPAADAKKK